MKDHQDNDAPEYDGPSKSQLKREMHALQDLGKRMLDLSNDQLETLPISETLRAAIEESRRIRQNEAKRRHLQYIGKVIRQEDDPEALAKAIDAFDAGSEEHTRRHHLAERFRCWRVLQLLPHCRYAAPAKPCSKRPKRRRKTEEHRPGPETVPLSQGVHR